MEEKKKEVAIKKIVIDLGRRELVLTTEEAMQLKEALNELFGKVVKEVVKEEHHHYSYPSWRWDWATPIYAGTINYPAYYQTTGGKVSTIPAGAITCGSNSAHGQAFSNTISYENKGEAIQCTIRGGVAEVKG